MYGFREIVRVIDQRIKAGDYPPESALPPRLELLQEFGVARATLDRAIQVLVAEKKLISRRGAGTFVCPRQQYRCLVAWVGKPSAENRANASLPHQVILPAELQRRSDWLKLYDFDGILWDCPPDFLLPVIEEMQGKVPQVVINRTLPGVSCVSTDHRGAYREIVLERLQAYPTGIPIFLQSELEQLPTRYRFDGFADACRASQRFYELWKMSADFENSCEILRQKIADLDAARPWLIFADSLRHTGPVMRIAAEQNWLWQQKQFYSDFDDDLPLYVWGRHVTTYLQDMPSLYRGAEQMLLDVINRGNPESCQVKLLYPRRVNGDT